MRLKSVLFYLKWAAQMSCSEDQFINVGLKGIPLWKKSCETQIWDTWCMLHTQVHDQAFFVTKCLALSSFHLVQ
jgi:hypothetical protein